MNRLLRIWVWLTQSRDSYYARMAAAVGVTFVVFGIIFHVIGRPGNAGLAWVAGGITVFFIGVAFSLMTGMRR